MTAHPQKLAEACKLAGKPEPSVIANEIQELHSMLSQRTNTTTYTEDDVPLSDNEIKALQVQEKLSPE